MLTEVKELLETQNRHLHDFIKTAGGQLKEFKTDLESTEQKLQQRIDGVESLIKRARYSSDSDGGEHKASALR